MKRLYEWLMIILAIAAVSTIWHQTPYNSYIIWLVWGIFFTDFLVQIIKSENKIDFFKKNPFLVLAIIPLDAVFQFARFARIIHLFRLKTITKYYAMPFVEKFKNKSSIGLFTLLMLVFMSSFSLYLFEPTVTSISDGFLNGFLAIIIFGHADTVAVSMAGQAIIITLTLLGVILHGITLGYIFKFFEKKKKLLPFFQGK